MNYTKQIIETLSAKRWEFFDTITNLFIELDIKLKQPIKIQHERKELSIDKIETGLFYSGKECYMLADFDWEARIWIIDQLKENY